VLVRLEKLRARRRCKLEDSSLVVVETKLGLGSIERYKQGMLKDGSF
jgi:hypothetical protein